MNEETTVDAIRRIKDLNFFWFLVDAPMAMDSQLIERFHDAVIRPDSIPRVATETMGERTTTDQVLGTDGQGSGEIPFVAKLAVTGKFERRSGRESSATRTEQSDVPRTHERLMEEIVAFYLLNFPDRVLRMDPVAETVVRSDSETNQGYDVLDATCATPGPRPIVLIDAPRLTKVMPMAGEFINGKLDVIYDSLLEALSTQDAPLERMDGEMDSTKKAENWKQLADRFDATKARVVLEEASRRNDNSRFDWIDFRLVWGSSGSPSPLHLHMMPKGQYPTGIFAHALVRRAYSNGVRIVGTLKSGGDINVLAIYER